VGDSFVDDNLVGRLFVKQVHAGQLFYVYKDKQGRTHIEDSIPGEFTKYGYKIVNDSGITIKEIPSVATKREKANAKKRRSEEKRAKDAQREKDQILLRRFTGLEDIRETGNKKILALQSQIDVTREHVIAFEKNLGELESQAENLRNNSKRVSDKDLRSIKRMKDNIMKNKKYIDQRREEQKKVKNEFIALIQQYRKLIKNK